MAEYQEGRSSSIVSRPSRALTWALVLSLISIVVVVFRGVLDHEFVHYDDSMNICDNSNVNGLTSENIRWMFTDTTCSRYMPLGWLCYAVDRQLFGLNPYVWHAGNLLVHLLNTLLLFFALKKVVFLAALNRESAQRERISNWCGAFGAFCWAINPLRVEPVAWASARIYGMLMLFALVWLFAWLCAQSTQNPQQRRCYSWLALGAYSASLLTYPIALFAPVLLLALDVFPFRRAPLNLSGWWQRENWNLWREKVPFFLVSAAVLAITVLARISPDPRFRPVTLEEFGMFSRVMQACYVLAYFVWKPWIPSSLSAAYPTLHAFDPFDWKFLASGIFVATTTFLVFRSYRRWPALFALWICHGLILLPVLGLGEYPHSAYDRYSHMHGVLWSAAIAGGLYLLWDFVWCRKIVCGMLVTACIWFASLAVAQVPVWNNTFALYGSIVARFGENPGRARFDETLGVFYLRAGQTNQAVESFKKAVHYDSSRTDRNRYVEDVIPRCERRLAEICLKSGDLSGAVNHLAAALKSESKPLYVVGLALKFSATLSRLGRESEALPWLKKAVETAPENPALHHALGNVMQTLGHDIESNWHFEEEQRLRAAFGKAQRL